MTEKLKTSKARQGVSGHGVRTVLMISLLLAVVAAIGVYTYGEQIDEDPTLKEQIENSE